MMKPTDSCLLAGMLLAHAAAAGPKPIEFDFLAPDNPPTQTQYSRELWAEVVTPGGQKLTLPAYYADGGLYAVRARPDEIGAYRFGAASETTLGIHKTNLVVSLVSPADGPEHGEDPTALHPDRPEEQAHARAHRRPSLPPRGANLAWAPDGETDGRPTTSEGLPAFAKANLNWMRIWMAHWDGLNLDWLPAYMGPSPKAGVMSEQVAENWDRILAAAEENGVYVQLVLQHHGQYTTANDSNWAENPWNAANPGGFLKAPEDFFTDPNARVITLMKYRYIVARWGWSPAMVAWELFNEVHWTDAMRHGHEADVARWHSDVASYIRSVDVYGHLITTSTENLRSPIYEKMDYCQPHLYAANMIAAARSVRPGPSDARQARVLRRGGRRPPAGHRRREEVRPQHRAHGLGEHHGAGHDGGAAVERLADHGPEPARRAWGGLPLPGDQPRAVQEDLKPFSCVVECRERFPMRIVGGPVLAAPGGARLRLPGGRHRAPGGRRRPRDPGRLCGKPGRRIPGRGHLPPESGAARL
jgi:hypothetical protein